MKFKIADETKKRFPIVDAGFDETGLSWVSIQTKEGIFTGTARVHPDDLEKGWYNRLAGQMIAHHRAYIEYFKFRKRLDRNTIKELEHIYCINKPRSIVSKCIFDRLCELQSNVDQYIRNINLFENRIQDKINGLEEYYKARNK